MIMIRVCERECVCYKWCVNTFHFGFNKNLYVHRPQGTETAEDAWWQLLQQGDVIKSSLAGESKLAVGRRREILSGSQSSLSQHFNAGLRMYIYVDQATCSVCVCVCVHWNTYTCSSVWIFFTLDLTSLICTQTSTSWDRWRHLMAAPSADCLEGKVRCGEEERDTVRLTLVAIAALSCMSQ